MKTKKTVLGVLGCIVFLFIGGTIVTDQIIDRENIRQQLYHAIEKQTGRKIQFDHLVVQLLPWPEIKASNITLTNMPKGQARYFVEAGQLTAKMNLWSLWYQKVDFDTLQLSEVKLHFEKNEDKQKNWEFTPTKESGHSEDSGILTHRQKWQVNFNSIHLDGVQGWYDDAYSNRHVRFFLKTVDVRQLDDSKIHFDIQGSNHGAVYTISGKLNHIKDLLQYHQGQPTFPVKFQFALSEYLHNQNVGNIHLNGTVNDFLKKRGYAITLHGTILNLQNLNVLFPHANLPSVENITLNSIIEDRSLTADLKAKPQIKLLQLHTGSVRIQSPYHDIHLNDMQFMANQLDENINLQVNGQMDGMNFRWMGDLGTLSNFQQILFSDLYHPIPVKGNFASDRYTAQIYGTIGGRDPSLNVKLNLLDLDGDLKNIGKITSHDVFYKGTVSLPFAFRQKSFHSLKADIIHHISAEGKVTGKDLQINRFKFDYFSTNFNWKDRILNLNSLYMALSAYALNMDLTYNLAQPEPVIFLSLHPSVIPMEWIDKKYKLMGFYSGPVEIIGHFTSKGTEYSQWISNLTGHMGLAGVNGILKLKGLEFYIGKAAKTLPVMDNIPVQCLAVHMNVNQEKLFFDTFTLQEKRLTLNGNGTFFIKDQHLDFHIVPDVMMGIIDASMPVRISGYLDKPVISLEKNKNKVFSLNINTLKKMIGPTDYCKNALLRAKEQ